MHSCLAIALARWATAPEGSSWAVIDGAWWALFFLLEQAEAQIAREVS